MDVAGLRTRDDSAREPVGARQNEPGHRPARHKCGCRSCPGSSSASSCCSGAPTGSRLESIQLPPGIIRFPNSHKLDQQECRQSSAKATPEGGGVLLYVAVLHRHGNADRGDHFRLLMGFSPLRLLTSYARTIRVCRLFADHDLGHAGDRNAYPSVGHRRDAWPRLCRYRRTLSLLRHPARLARRGADGLGHGLERAVRQSAEDHRQSSWACRRF